MNKSGLFASGSALGTFAVATVLGFAGSAWAQCTSDASGAIADNDNQVCGATTPDPNGGCNVNPVSYQDIGSYGNNADFKVAGTMGTYIPAGGTTFTSRDLDWFSIELTEPCKLNLALNNDAPASVMFVLDGLDCDTQTQLYGIQVTGNCHEASFFLDAGEYVVIVTTPFEADAANPIYDCAPYVLHITTEPGNFACDESVGSDNACDVAHGNPGCNDYDCCNEVCIVNPLCCDLAWDQSCVDDGAVAICGYFIYDCPAAGGAPANNCVANAQIVSVGDTVDFNNANATNDGPSAFITGCGSAMGKDLWFVVQAPANGQLVVDGCASPEDFDSVTQLYAFGDSPVIDPTTLPERYIGCVDDTCGVTAGRETVTLLDAVAGEWYGIRIGGFDDGAGNVASGASSFTISLKSVVFGTGPQSPVQNLGAGTNVNLGLSSGSIAAASPQRWLAQAFSVEAPTVGGANAWQLTEIYAKGFVPAGITNETLNWIIWDRTGEAAPVDGDQIASGNVPFPVGFDDGSGDNAATASHAIELDLVLQPGDYYLTVFGARSDDYNSGGNQLSNFAWFIYAKEGINLTQPADSQGSTRHAWRSATFPAPGFAFYTGLEGTYEVQPGDDPDDLYNTAFTIYGEPTSSGTPCPYDLNDDGNVGPADLALLLGGWGSPYGPAELAELLGAWGPCPK